MGLLRLAVLGPPEVFHDSSRLTFALRKAHALLLYLAVEGGLHPRSKLAAFLWPDSDPHDARTSLRSALLLLRSLLADPDASASQHDLSPGRVPIYRARGAHLHSQHDALGLNPQAPLELDLHMVQQAYHQAQLHSTTPPLEQRAALVIQFERALALVRGPFLDGFWLGEDAPFDEWREQQQRLWQVRLHLLLDRLSCWQETGGELESATATLTHWLALDPLAEEAYRRLMRVHLARGEPTAALQVYVTGRARLAEALQIEPSPETLALAERVRVTVARRQSPPARPALAESRPPSELVTPLLGRAGAFRQLVEHFQQARQGQPRAVLMVGEAGIGKTRLASEFGAWARAQGADVLNGQAFELGGRLPYQPLVEALRERLEVENAPEDLLEDLWLAELSRLLPELRVRYPDLLAPTEDELAAKVRLFEAVARLLDALAQRAPLVLLLDDLHWTDIGSLDLVRYLGRYWKGRGTRVLLLGTMRSEELDLQPALAALLADLERDLPVTHLTLQSLSQAETIQLVQSLLTEQEGGLVALGQWLFKRTGGQPFYLLEMLKMFQDRQMLIPRLSSDGVWKLELVVDMAAALEQETFPRELLPRSVRTMIQARLAPLSPLSRQIMMACAVLGNQVTSLRLWQLANVEAQEGVTALEEAVGSGILCEEEAGMGRLSSYRFSHDLIRQVVYTEIGEARRQLLHRRAFEVLHTAGAPAARLAYHALEAGQAAEAYRYLVEAGDEAMAVFAVDDAIMHYGRARTLLHDDQREQTVPSPTEVEHLYAYLARAYGLQNAWEKAREVYEELLAYAQQQRLPALISMTLNCLAILAAQQSVDMPKVRALLEEARHIANASHDQKTLAETEWNLAQITASAWNNPKSALPYGLSALELARATNDKELEARSLLAVGLIHFAEGTFLEILSYLEASLALYAALGDGDASSKGLPSQYMMIGSPPTQQLTNRATEAHCRGLLALAQVNCGQVQNSIRNGRIALLQSQEIKNTWAQIGSVVNLNHGLLEAGLYEEAFVLTQQAVALARTLPLTLALQRLLTVLGSTYQALRQVEEAQSVLDEALAVPGIGRFRLSVLTRLCMNSALVGDWEQAYRYAVETAAVRKSIDAMLFMLDFYRHYETEALLRGGQERQAREEVQRLGEHLGPYRRFRIPYLRSLAVLSQWDGKIQQTVEQLREAASGQSRLVLILG